MSFEDTTLPLEELCQAVIDCPHSTPVWMDYGVVVLRSSNIRNGRLDLSNPSFTDENHYDERSSVHGFRRVTWSSLGRRRWARSA